MCFSKNDTICLWAMKQKAWKKEVETFTVVGNSMNYLIKLLRTTEFSHNAYKIHISTIEWRYRAQLLRALIPSVSCMIYLNFRVLKKEQWIYKSFSVWRTCNRWATLLEKSWNLEAICSNPTAQAGPPGKACLGPYPGDFWVSPRREALQTLLVGYSIDFNFIT